MTSDQHYKTFDGRNLDFNGFLCNEEFENKSLLMTQPLNKCKSDAISKQNILKKCSLFSNWPRLVVAVRGNLDFSGFLPKKVLRH